MLEETHRKILIALLRITIGWIFLWAFIDKLIGLSFSTCAGKGVLCSDAWISGGSPTVGFLTHGTHGPLASVFTFLGTAPFIHGFVDWLFMAGLLGIGVALIAGACIKPAVYSGALLLILMWAAAPPATNPFIDDHIVYAIVLVLLRWLNAGHYFGLGEWWENHDLVKKHPWLD